MPEQEKAINDAEKSTNADSCQLDTVVIPQAIIVQCEGNCAETMEFKKIDWGDGIEYYIEFRTSTFYAGQSVIGIMKERIKFAWQAIRKGNYIHQEILTNKKAMGILRDELTKMLAV